MSRRERPPKGGWLPPGPDTWNGETREQYEAQFAGIRPTPWRVVFAAQIAALKQRLGMSDAQSDAPSDTRPRQQELFPL